MLTDPAEATQVESARSSELASSGESTSTDVQCAAIVDGRDVPHLLGFGPLTPAVARALVTEPPANLTISYYEVLETEHQAWLRAAPESQHDPSAALNRHVQTYYPTCIAPACSVRATSTDTDHTIEYPLGPTHVGNLRPLCRRHHNLKTHHGHQLRTNPDGQLTWITPLGTTRLTQHQARLTE